jgi:hypothetical protein
MVQSMTFPRFYPDPKSEMQIMKKSSGEEVRVACTSSEARLSLSFDQTIVASLVALAAFDYFYLDGSYLGDCPSGS